MRFLRRALVVVVRDPAECPAPARPCRADLDQGDVPDRALYLVSPIDLLPDAIIGIGEIDDLVILYAGLRLFVFLSPAHVVAYHRAALSARRPYSPMPSTDVVIEAEFKREA